MQGGKFLDQRQPDPAALVGPALSTLDPMEPFEQPGQFIGGDAGAGIADGKLDRTRHRRRASALP